MKTKNKNQKNNEKVTYNLDEYFVTRMNQRFSEININKLDEIISFSKRYSIKQITSCPFPVVCNKLRNPEYPNSVYLVNPKFNMIMVSVGNVLKNVLYLDGKDGYSFA
jgi:hypothetical protein